MEISLFNSLTKKVEQFKPLKDGLVRIYSCGPTVYNYAHIGNMRAFLFADLLQRVMKVVGKYRVQWVMNITNIDDKTIRDSKLGSPQWKPEMGVQTEDAMQNLIKLTEYYEQCFFDDINKLGIRLENFYKMPRATKYIFEMQELILLIVDKGFGYVSNGSVYFDISEYRKKYEYGRLFKIDFENFQEGVRIDADEYEREEISDFVLWKAKKDGEPYWEFNINGENCDGRPGWHIECSAMEKDILGLPFDVHTGGIDLKFPHHEDEIAQSMAGYGIDPTAFWCHNEFVEVEGKKMSKTFGNFFTLRDLTAKGIDPLDIRFTMLSSHYSSTFNFTFSGIASAAKARKRIQDYISELFLPDTGFTVEMNAEQIRNEIFGELGNDLHTPKALAHIFNFINKYPAKELNKEDKAKLIELFTELNLIFDCWEIAPAKEEIINIPQEIYELADKRVQAKLDKNYQEADRLRNLIAEAGYSLKDTKDSYILSKI